MASTTTPSQKRDSENQPISPEQATGESSENPKDEISEDERPPLPPRPQKLPQGQPTAHSDSGLNPYSTAHKLQSGPTTALSLANVNVQALDDVNRENYVSLAGDGGLEKTVRPSTSATNRRGSRFWTETGDSASIRSFMPGSETPIEAGSLFGDFPGFGTEIPFRNTSARFEENYSIFNAQSQEDDAAAIEFEEEFDSVGESSEDENEEQKLERWRRKKKQFFILSSAGKPIYTRHGDGGLISPYIGIIQTIISFYQESGGPLKSFSAGKTKIVILAQGPLYLVAISSILESQAHLRAQLEALYMQILSTLTLPALDHIFTVRPSSDLRRPLQGTESLLSSLADSFTKGSPSTLLSALESLKIRKSHRQVISNTFLKTRVEPLLYGLLVAGGRLVSVVRPKKHSLHPGDLQLIFNMIFEADGIKAGGGESWIPICLPGFNNRGYLYMYVSFLDVHKGRTAGQGVEEVNKDDIVAIILISPNKESFYALHEMRDSLVEQMEKNGSMDVLKVALEKGRPAPTDIVPGTVVRHFLYKSKANVQFTMSSYSPQFMTVLDRRRLMSAYHSLHLSVHEKPSHVKVQYCVSSAANSLAWVTPTFELYCVASPLSNRNALSQGANKIALWVQREQERLFIIGGAVF
ncbi:vacuolar fusion protein mon1 [Arthroderma uncinatum]|uniref:vacuolar fusion protein mon1 n=1 Tax=Arthroderma uncinatum TaxID=74035 RepID=UPI00144A8D56|nr:vacuolar fusion protein mon1 [Arthroderma uncinatum]KAF3480379.1 vacuolar fusion protein mon1 [Arthroderma uncinatum]